MEALGALRSVRFRKRTAKIEPFDAFYQAYITAIIGGIAVLLLSGAAGGDQLTLSQLDRLQANLPAGLGVLAAAALGLGLRSGSRGGPVALEAADVRHVLLSPINIGAAMRRPILRQARFATFVAVVVGGIGGQLLARRTEGHALAWTAYGSLWAVAVTVLFLASAWLAAGHRMSRAWATSIAALVLVWPIADAANVAPTSPFAWLGRIPFLVHHFDPLALVTLPVILVAAVVGVTRIGGISIEEMARRSALVGEMRFAATMRDLRTVLVLRRSLLQERPRNRPWLPRFRSGPSSTSPVVVYIARSWRSLLRIPAARLLRMAILAAIGGAAARAAWDGVLPLALVTGLCAFLVGLDAIEPLSQEFDHETILELVAVPTGTVHSSLLIVPTATAVVMSGFGVAGAATGGLNATGVIVAVTVSVACALTGVAGAAVSTVRGAPDPNDLSMLMLPPEAASSRVVFDAALPPAIACLGLVPFFIAQRADSFGDDPVLVLNNGATIAFGVFVLMTLWVRSRPAFRAQMNEAFNASEARKRAKRLDPEAEED